VRRVKRMLETHSPISVKTPCRAHAGDAVAD